MDSTLLKRISFASAEEDGFAFRSVAACAAIAIFLHLVCLDQYGYFRDELYYLACSNHLSWGYVDQPPLSIALLKVWTGLFGDGLVAIRLLGTLISAGTILLMGRITFELGGSRPAQILACLCVAFSPVHQVVAHLYSMNSIDILLWATAILFFLRIRARNSWIEWLYLGLTLGLGLMNKLSVLWLILGLFFAFILTKERGKLLQAKPYVALGIAFLIMSPFLVWQVQNGWPTIEFMRNAVDHKLLRLTPLEFVGTQIVVTNPIASVVWITGLVVAWRVKELRPYAILFTTVLTILLISGKSRENYLSPAYAAILPLGAISVTRYFEKERLRTWIPAVAVSMVGLLLVPLGLPMLPPSWVMKIATTSPIKPPSVTNGKTSPMQGHADMFGWPELGDSVLKIQRDLAAQGIDVTDIWASNYGQAAALVHFAPQAGNVISCHNQFWIWGTGDWDGKNLLVVGETNKEFRNCFSTYKVLAYVGSPLAVPAEQNRPVALAKGLKCSPEEFWSKFRRFE